MSLNWDVRKVRDGVVWDAEGKMKPRANVIIWSTIAIQLGEITEKNVDEFYRRLNLWQYGVSPLLTYGGEPYYLTLEDVRDMIGLKVNAISITAKAWDRHFKDVLFRDVQSTVWSKTRKKEEVAAGD